MGSSYFGEPNMGNHERGGNYGSSSSSSSSRKGKKSNSDKPKQPQRGLGVAQLEKIRLHGQMAGCSSYHPPLQSPFPTTFNNEVDMRIQSTTPYSAIPSSTFSYTTPSSSSSASNYGLHPNIMMGFGEHERAQFRYGDSQPTTVRWDSSINILETQHFVQPSLTRHLLNPNLEDSMLRNNKKHGSDHSVGSGSQNSESSETQELDLELRLSL